MSSGEDVKLVDDRPSARVDDPIAVVESQQGHESVVTQLRVHSADNERTVEIVRDLVRDNLRRQARRKSFT